MSVKHAVKAADLKIICDYFPLTFDLSKKVQFSFADFKFLRNLDVDGFSEL